MQNIELEKLVLVERVKIEQLLPVKLRDKGNSIVIFACVEELISLAGVKLNSYEVFALTRVSAAII